MKKLQWDSNFWGVDVFHIDSILEIAELERLDKEPLLVQALVHVSDLPYIHKLESNGFKFQESKVTFIKKKLINAENDFSNFRSLTMSDIKSYKDGFFELYGENTRYGVFPEKKVNKFYYTWLVNSTNGKMDDECIGYFKDGQLAGFVTYKKKNNLVVIGLLGVLPRFRGCGISQILLNFINYVAVKNSSVGITVSTQGKNVNAINAYIKNGYHVASIDQWYYLIKGELK